MTPIYATSTYAQQSPGVHKGFEYSRTQNPTRFAFERCVADLEEGQAAFAFASGLAAIATVLELLDHGSHVLVCDDLYGGSYRLFERVRRRTANLDFTLSRSGRSSGVRGGDPAQHADDLDRKPHESAVETGRSGGHRGPGPAARRLGGDRQHLRHALLPTPVGRGLRPGVHSVTKYLNGHSDMIGGVAVVGDNAELAERLRFLQNAVGAVAGPFDSFLALRGLKTLALRMERHCSNAMQIAEWLQHRPDVVRVIYPGLPSHPQHALARRQMNGFGGMVSAVLAGGAGATAAAFWSGAKSSRWPKASAGSRAWSSIPR